MFIIAVYGNGPISCETTGFAILRNGQQNTQYGKQQRKPIESLKQNKTFSRLFCVTRWKVVRKPVESFATIHVRRNVSHTWCSPKTERGSSLPVSLVHWLFNSYNLLYLPSLNGDVRDFNIHAPKWKSHRERSLKVDTTRLFNVITTFILIDIDIYAFLLPYYINSAEKYTSLARIQAMIHLDDYPHDTAYLYHHNWSEDEVFSVRSE